MAFTGMNLSDAANVLKTFYIGPVREQLNQGNVLLSNLERDTSRTAFRGKEAYIPLHTGRNVGVGARAESGTLPAAGNQGYTSSVWHMAYLYGRVALTGPAIAASQGSEGSFVELLDSEMKGLLQDVKNDCNRQLWHDGSALLTDVSTASSGTSTTVTVDSTKFLSPGMVVDIKKRADLAAITSGDGQTIQSITSSTAFVMDTTTTTEVDEGVYVGGVASNSTSREMWGLEAIVSASDPGNHGTEAAATRLGQIDRSSNSFWKANVVAPAAANGLLDDSLVQLQEAYDQSDIEGDAQPGIILTSHACRREIAGALTGLRRFSDPGQLKGGWTGIQFNNAVIVADKDASTTNDPANASAGVWDLSGDAYVAGDFNRFYFIAPDSMHFQVLEDWQWMDEGGVLVRSGVGTSGVDEFEATLFSYQNLVCTRPNANVLLKDVASTTQA